MVLTNRRGPPALLSLQLHTKLEDFGQSCLGVIPCDKAHAQRASQPLEVFPRLMIRRFALDLRRRISVVVLRSSSFCSITTTIITSIREKPSRSARTSSSCGAAATARATVRRRWPAEEPREDAGRVAGYGLRARRAAGKRRHGRGAGRAPRRSHTHLLARQRGQSSAPPRGSSGFATTATPSFES